MHKHFDVNEDAPHKFKISFSRLTKTIYLLFLRYVELLKMLSG
jgi:hypothetical protein